jgi:XRE family aerobic/anaerobic benzoate catabolism transcriptional regulator
MDREAILEAFGSRLRAERKRQRLSRRELGEMSKTSSVSIGHWECGRFAPNILALMAIADALDCTMAYLLGEEDE